MKHLAALALSVLLLVGCHGGSPTDLTGLLQKGQWVFSWGSMEGQPTDDGNGGFYFKMPMSPSTVNYILRKQDPVEVGQILTAVYAVDLSADAKLVGSDDVGDNPARVYFVLEDEIGNRWWAPTSGQQVDQIRAGMPISIPLVAQCSPNGSGQWTNVSGKCNEEDFNAFLKHISLVGITFGGRYAFGHGACLTKGDATFRVTYFAIEGKSKSL